MRFQDKVAVITAAASGIGRATCDIIGAEGGIVCAVDNNAERLDATVAAMADQSAQRLKWKAMVPAAQSTWSKLETQELMQMQGNVHKLAGLIQLRYRTSREEADQQVAAFLALNP